MENITLGRTGLEVTRICFGTWQFGGDWGSLDERDNVAAMQRALELGINFFDTAQAYGFGASEQLVSKALGGELRSAQYVRLMRETIGAQRMALLDLRDGGEISDEVMRRVERELDLEESRLGA